MELWTSIKEPLVISYKANPSLTTFCIYALFLLLAIFTHQGIKGLAKQTDAKPLAPNVINQNSKDSTCSNVVADHDSSVSCNEQKDGKDHNAPSGGLK